MSKPVLRLSLLSACLLAIVSSASAASRGLLAHGSPEMYWVARIDQLDSSGMQSTIQARPIGGDARWTRIAQIGSRVVSLANRGTQLAALLDSGDWMMLWDGGNSTGVLPRDGAKLLLLAGDGDTLWAIASAGGGSRPATAAATQPATTMSAETRLLYRLDRGQWTRLSELPDSAQQARLLSLAVFDREPTLAALSADGQIRSFNWMVADDTWEAARSIRADANAVSMKLLSGLSRPVLWLADKNGDSVIFLRDTEWSGPTKLALPNDAHGAAAYDAVVAGQNIRLLALIKDRVNEYSFSADGALRGRTEVPAPAVPPEERQFHWLSALAAAMLMIVLLNSIRHRIAIAPDALASAGIKLAPHGLRLLAGTIDALPLIGTMAIVLMRSGDGGPPSTEALAAMSYPFYISGAVYLLHTLVSELSWGWTIGKRVCGLRVLAIDGSAPGPRAIVLRNLLRVIDLTMFFPLLLVLISPLRQRVGDVAAETLVVFGEPVKKD